MHRLSLLVGACVLGALLAPASPALAQPAHPAVRYSCMSEPSDGSGWPWVAEGVPEVVERLHPGYEIGHYTALSVPGLRLFVVRGRARRDGAPERYASVDAVDASGALVQGRELFLRASATSTDPDELARYAMAFLLRRADERPLLAPSAALSETVRDHIARPWRDAAHLHLWVRADSLSPYASLVTVDLATGAHHGDVW